MKERVKLSDLIMQVELFLDSQGYSSQSIINYRTIGINGFRRHYANCGKVNYSEVLSWSFVLANRKQYETGVISRNKFIFVRKVYEMLKECYETGKITHHALPPWKPRQLSRYFTDILRAYQIDKTEEGYSAHSIAHQRSNIVQFLFYAMGLGCNDVSGLRGEDLSAYIINIAEKNPKRADGAIRPVRSFVEYLAENGLVDDSLPLVLNVKSPTRSRVIYGFTKEEIERILQAVDRGTPVGKRDYAILLLGARTGLRSIDVFTLKLTDVDWRGGVLNIVQSKTGKPLSLPLEDEVGNAMAEYILKARPQTDSTYLFIRQYAPFIHCSTGLGGLLVQKYANSTGIQWQKGDCKGFHSFRRSLGAHMLAADVPLHTISEVLGHSSTASTKPYLATNLLELSFCAMELTFACRREELQ